MKLSKHFDRSEFACKCGCGFDTVDTRLLEILVDVRQWFKSPVQINSAARCLEHNRIIGSKDSSQHVLGKAADIVVLNDNIPIKDVVDYLKDISEGTHGIGIYSLFTHIDVREERARWLGI